MAISFDTTVGGSSSTSYVTVAEFVAYMDNMPFAGNFPSQNATTLIKRLLNLATEIIDRECFYGTPTDMENQALEFPRTGICNKRGYSYSDNELPLRLKDAVCELALWLYENESNHNSENPFDIEDSVNINGDVSITFTRNMYLQKLPTIVKSKLRDIGTAWDEKQARVSR